MSGLSRTLLFLFLCLQLPAFAVETDEEKIERVRSCAQNFTFLEVSRHYDSIPPSYLDDLAAAKGLDSHKDLQNVSQHILPVITQPNSSILEIGVGNGRVLDWLLSHHLKAKYRGVELSEAQTDRLQEKYPDSKNVHIEKGNIVHFYDAQKFDLVLWMWSGFLELNPQEKLLALRSVAKSQNSGGKLILDIPTEIKGETIVEAANRFVSNPYVKEGYEPFYGHLVTDAELIQMTTDAGYVLSSQIPYETWNGKETIKRRSFVFLRR